MVKKKEEKDAVSPTIQQPMKLSQPMFGRLSLSIISGWLEPPLISSCVLPLPFAWLIDPDNSFLGMRLMQLHYMPSLITGKGSVEEIRPAHQSPVPLSLSPTSSAERTLFNCLTLTAVHLSLLTRLIHTLEERRCSGSQSDLHHFRKSCHTSCHSETLELDLGSSGLGIKTPSSQILAFLSNLLMFVYIRGSFL